MQSFFQCISPLLWDDIELELPAGLKVRRISLQFLEKSMLNTDSVEMCR